MRQADITIKCPFGVLTFQFFNNFIRNEIKIDGKLQSMWGNCECNNRWTIKLIFTLFKTQWRVIEK